MGYVLGIILLLTVIFGFRFSIELIVDTFPGMRSLFSGNGAAIAIFALSLVMSLPLLITVPMAIIVGIFFAKVWYAVVLQYLALEGVWFVFTALITLIFGVAPFAIGGASEWLRKRNNIQ